LGAVNNPHVSNIAHFERVNANGKPIQQSPDIPAVGGAGSAAWNRGAGNIRIDASRNRP